MARQSKMHRAGVIRDRNGDLYLGTAIRISLFGKEEAVKVVERMRYGYRAN